MLIDATDLHKTYRDSRGRPVAALRGVSFRAARGEFVAVTGVSGCGKTTLLNVLGCLDRADTGTYRFDGEDVSGWPERRRAALRNRRIGFIFQGFHLLSFLTVRENIELPFLYGGNGTRPGPGPFTELMRPLGLEGVEERYPGELSGGQQQRVAIARAMVVGADLLLADEPTGNLDADTADGVLGAIEQLVGQGKTVILVTHDPAVARRASRIILMEEGTVAAPVCQPEEPMG